MAKGHGLPVIPHGSRVYNYHLVMAHTNAPYAEYVTVEDGRDIRPISDIVDGEPIPTDGSIQLDDSPGFGVDLEWDRLVLWDR